MWRKATGPTESRGWHGDIPIHHRYTLGVAGERFFKAMRDERMLLASRCPNCGQSFLPPKIYCEVCFQQTADWLPVEGPGYLKTFTLLHVDLEEEPLEPPQAVGLVAWPDIRGGLIHRIAEVGVADIIIGMGLEPMWAEERAGSMEDIRYFRPVST